MSKSIFIRMFLFAILSVLITSLVFPIRAFAQDDAEKVVIQVMIRENELSDEQIIAFEDANPDIDVVRVDDAGETLRDFETALASDAPPDVFRIKGEFAPGLYNRELLLDITDYLAASEMIDVDDLASGAIFYVFDEHYYGLPKDWSLDFMLFINTQMFEEAGIPIPDADIPLTYAELAEYAQQLTIYEGDTLVQMGFNPAYFERNLTRILLQMGGELFNEDQTEVNLTNNPMAEEVLKYYYELASNGVVYTPSNPAPSWLAFSEGNVAIQQNGYWFQATITEDLPTYGHVKMLPAPTWDRNLPRISPTQGPTGIVLFAGTEHPAEAFRFFEYYIAGEPAVARAQSGWGLPSLRSLESELPAATELQQQALAVSQAEMEYADYVLPVYPYSTFPTIFQESWDRNLELALAGEITFDDLLVTMEQEINLAILDEMFSSN